MALTLIFAILGALLGFVSGELIGAVAGGLIGAMAIQVLNIREEIHTLRQQVAQLQKTQTNRSAVAPAVNTPQQQTAVVPASQPTTASQPQCLSQLRL